MMPLAGINHKVTARPGWRAREALRKKLRGEISRSTLKRETIYS